MSKARLLLMFYLPPSLSLFLHRPLSFREVVTTLFCLVQENYQSSQRLDLKAVVVVGYNDTIAQFTHFHTL